MKAKSIFSLMSSIASLASSISRLIFSLYLDLLKNFLAIDANSSSFSIVIIFPFF